MDEAHITGMKLRECEQTFRLLIDAVRDYAIFMLDVDGRIFSWNTGAQLLKGYRADEIIGQCFSRFYTEADRHAGRPSRLLTMAADLGRVEDECLRVRKDGTTFWANVIITALFDERGQVRGYAKITRDLTERRRIEEELRHSVQRLDHAKQQLQELNEAKSYSISIASHEVK